MLASQDKCSCCKQSGVARRHATVLPLAVKPGSGGEDASAWRLAERRSGVPRQAAGRCHPRCTHIIDKGWIGLSRRADAASASGAGIWAGSAAAGRIQYYYYRCYCAQACHGRCRAGFLASSAAARHRTKRVRPATAVGCTCRRLLHGTIRAPASASGPLAGLPSESRRSRAAA